ncbi:MAG: acyltransferase [Chitinophagaceae bacterium]|nr:acyltransferase [Chitinophagaceae bacterium]
MHRMRRHYFHDQIPEMIWGYTTPEGNHLSQVRISNTTFINSKENLVLGNHVFIGHYNMIDASNDLVIEEGCQVTNFVSILTHSSHQSIRLYGSEYAKHSEHIGYIKGKVVIGKYSFIGPHSVIMPGTTIGKGSSVSAFSYVKGNFPPFSILAGNPAIVVGDTRKMDQPFLDAHPEIKTFYNSWSQ